MMSTRRRLVSTLFIVSSTLAVLGCAPTPVQPGATTASHHVGETVCSYEENCECTSPGITLRWKAFYCMSIHGSDDAESEAVQRCTFAADPKDVAALSACAQNNYWRDRICRFMYSKSTEDLQRCLTAQASIPKFVKTGI